MPRTFRVRSALCVLKCEKRRFHYQMRNDALLWCRNKYWLKNSECSRRRFAFCMRFDTVINNVNMILLPFRRSLFAPVYPPIHPQHSVFLPWNLSHPLAFPHTHSIPLRIFSEKVLRHFDGSQLSDKKSLLLYSVWMWCYACNMKTALSCRRY